MKSLSEFIKESMTLNESESTSVTLNFGGLEGAEDTLKSLEGKEGCTIEDDKVTISVNADNASKLDSVVDILQQFAETLRSSSKRSSDEQYAQKTKAFAENVSKIVDKIDEIENPEEE